mmetsp:Transcript_42852/g.126957  ORF Transcript_42852/g.126957 Transcript_42852/m.126957 type:complete len:311 (+) Transcript_42852:162-1094(+)
MQGAAAHGRLYMGQPLLARPPQGWRASDQPEALEERLPALPHVAGLGEGSTRRRPPRRRRPRRGRRRRLAAELQKGLHKVVLEELVGGRPPTGRQRGAGDLDKDGGAQFLSSQLANAEGDLAVLQVGLAAHERDLRRTLGEAQGAPNVLTRHLQALSFGGVVDGHDEVVALELHDVGLHERGEALLAAGVPEMEPHLLPRALEQDAPSREVHAHRRQRAAEQLRGSEHPLRQRRLPRALAAEDHGLDAQGGEELRRPRLPQLGRAAAVRARRPCCRVSQGRGHGALGDGWPPVLGPQVSGAPPPPCLPPS